MQIRITVNSGMISCLSLRCGFFELSFIFSFHSFSLSATAGASFWKCEQGKQTGRDNNNKKPMHNAQVRWWSVLPLMTTTAKALGDLLWFQLHILSWWVAVQIRLIHANTLEIISRALEYRTSVLGSRCRPSIKFTVGAITKLQRVAASLNGREKWCFWEIRELVHLTFALSDVSACLFHPFAQKLSHFANCARSKILLRQFSYYFRREVRACSRHRERERERDGDGQ